MFSEYDRYSLASTLPRLQAGEAEREDEFKRPGHLFDKPNLLHHQSDDEYLRD